MAGGGGVTPTHKDPRSPNGFFSLHVCLQNVLIVEVSSRQHAVVFHRPPVSLLLLPVIKKKKKKKDIVETGRTMQALLSMLSDFNPKMVKVVRWVPRHATPRKKKKKGRINIL